MFAKETAASSFPRPKMLAALGLKLRLAFRFSASLMCDPVVSRSAEGLFLLDLNWGFSVFLKRLIAVLEAEIAGLHLLGRGLRVELSFYIFERPRFG